MKVAKLVVLVSMITLCLSASLVSAEEPAAKPAPVKKLLTSPYSVTVGDVLALNLSNVVNAMKPIDAPMVVSYDKDEKKIEVAIFGARSSADGYNGAKAAIEDFLKAGLPMLKMVSEQFGVDLTDDQLRILYFNRNDGFKLILSRENGIYVMQ